ncbi:MAG: hypothetical protein HQ485_08250 [Acidobacteria bacterium]|nr:hypothetical protein [Acidobacteriota bacterium]
MKTQNIKSHRVAFLAPLVLGVFLGLPDIARGQPPTPAPEARTLLSGYMEFHYNKPEFVDGELDFHRFVLLVTHRYSDRIRFVGELEVAHAFVEGLEEAGELELEQAYLDFLFSRGLNIRAGLMLMPVGIINERHEPPVFYGVERPLVDTALIPTTWFEIGVGVHGEVGRGWRYRAFLTAPLDAERFTAEDGLRDGRQKGSRTNAGRLAATARLEYVGTPGLTTGVSVWTGRSGFQFRPRFDVPVHLIEADARYSFDRLELRAEAVQVSVGNTPDLNDAVGRTIGIDPNVAKTMRGGYLEAGYRVVSGARFGDIGAFVRYESVDTQHRMADGYLPLREFDRTAWVVGATYWPDADIALKFDYTMLRNRSVSIVAPNSFNLGLGWWF